MNSDIIKESLHKLSQVITFKYPAIGWYFSSEQIEDSFVFKKNNWVCMFMYIKIVMNTGRRLRFSDDYEKACCGPSEYFGYCELTGSDGQFIAETERFKKDRILAKKYFEESLQNIHLPSNTYLYMERVEDIDSKRDIDVINLFPDLPGLAKLTVLSNYDRETNSNNVMTPFASGCQSIFTIPYDQSFHKQPKSVIGLMDPLVRDFIPEDMVSLSVPSNRFIEMTNNIKRSFLDTKS